MSTMVSKREETGNKCKSLCTARIFCVDKSFKRNRTISNYNVEIFNRHDFTTAM